MADASPRTDISTDVDTDDKNPRVKLHFTFHGIFFFLDFEPVQIELIIKDSTFPSVP